MTTTWASWRPRLAALCDDLRAATSDALERAERGDDPEALRRPEREGVGDVSFGLDLPSERWLAAWFEQCARQGPLSVLTEETGWSHRGPAPDGGTCSLPGFDHGGPRIAFDPIDGTRNLMAGLRSAWTVVSFADPGRGEPRLADVTGGIVSELPTRSDAPVARYVAAAGGVLELELAGPNGVGRAATLVTVDSDDRPDHGYFPFFRYDPTLRPALATLEADFFARLARDEGADVRTCYDDQYISNAGQLVLLVRGIYRSIVDARALLGRRAGRPTTTSKPYDVAGAIVCARAAGAELTTADGSPLDFPIDATTPVDFAGWVNAATRRRLEPHWLAALG